MRQCKIHPTAKEMGEPKVGVQIGPTAPLKCQVPLLGKDTVIQNLNITLQAADTTMHLSGMKPVSHQDLGDRVQVTHFSDPESELKVCRDRELWIE